MTDQQQPGCTKQFDCHSLLFVTATDEAAAALCIAGNNQPEPARRLITRFHLARSIFYISACFLFICLSGPAVMAEQDLRKSLSTNLQKLEDRSNQELDRNSKTINSLKTSIQQTIEKKKQETLDEVASSSEDLSLPSTTTGPGWDIEKRRAELRRKVESWTGEDTALYVPAYELRYAIADAIEIAGHDGKQVATLARIYEKMQKLIREADFRNFDLGPPPDQDDRLSTTLYSWMTWGMFAEEELARYREKLQTYRMGLYKKAGIAYVRALISMAEPNPACTAVTAVAEDLEFNGVSLHLAGCPDPSIQHLKDYYKAIQKIQSADADVILAELEYLQAEQQIVTDMAAAIPLVGESIDLYQAYLGETTAGYCLSPFERSVMAVMVVVPLVGPDAVKLAMKKSDRFADAVLDLRAYFSDVLYLVTDTSQRMSKATLELGQEMTEVFAEKIGSNSKSLTKLAEFFERMAKSGVLKSGDEVARETLEKTLREARRDAIWIRDLPEEMREAAIAKSSERMARNLQGLQGTRAQRIARSNMVPEHIEALEKLVTEHPDWVLVYRSINPDAARRIMEDYATKGMNIKGKSADWGAHAGFIPTDQNLSKLGNPNRSGGIDIAEVTNFQKKVRECLKSVPPCAHQAHLKLKVDGIETPVMIVRDKATGKETTALFDEVSGSYLNRDGGPLDFVVDARDAKPMMVLADSSGRPVVADYDLMNMGYTGRHESPSFHQDKGFISGQEETMLEASNRAIAGDGGFGGGDISHHGAENWYPGSPGALDAADDVVSVFDHEMGGLMIIPQCDSECMIQWCMKEKQCNPAAICKGAVVTGCIPPDPNRLLKDYYHHKRLGKSTLGPNSAWQNWGGYNPLAGWSFQEYVVELKTNQMAAASRAQRAAIAGGVKSAAVIVTSDSVKNALPKCTPPPPPVAETETAP